MESWIRLKAGEAEVEFRGSEGFVREALPGLVGFIKEISSSEGLSDDDERKTPLPSDSNRQIPVMTVNTVAARLNTKQMKDLVMAACAYLTVIRGKERSERQEILDGMKSAQNYYRVGHRKSLTQLLESLVKDGKLLETEKGTYAVDARAKSDLEAKLGIG